MQGSSGAPSAHLLLLDGKGLLDGGAHRHDHWPHQWLHHGLESQGVRVVNHKRTSWVWMGKASSMEGRSASIMAVSPKSYTTCCRMSRSAVRPSARKITRIGRSVRM